MYKLLGYSERNYILNKLWCMQCIKFIKENIETLKKYLVITEKIKSGYNSYITKVNYNTLNNLVRSYEFIAGYFKNSPYTINTELLLGYRDIKDLFYELVILQNIKLISLYIKSENIKRIDYFKLNINLYNSKILKNTDNENLIAQAFDHIMELLGYKGYVYLQEAEPITDYYELDIDYCLYNYVWDLRVRLPLSEDKLTSENFYDIASWCEDVMYCHPQETGYNWSYFDKENQQISIIFEWYSKFDYDLLNNFLNLIKNCEKLKMARS